MSQLLNLPEISKYKLLEEIGHGGMATVYRARDTRLGREVAVKVIHRHLRDSVEIAGRFALEATAIAKLRHRNVVEVYDVSDKDSEERFLVVEYVSGYTLRALLKREGALCPELAVAIAVEVGKGLAHAHCHGVIHRDVKPENVLLQIPSNASAPQIDDGLVHVKLTDFGIAKLLDSQGVTSTGQVLGSPSHMAPEQIEGKVVDERADVFALGVLLYECLTGELPFAGEHPAQVLRKVLAGEHRSAERVCPRVGAGYSRIVDKALARLAEDRFQTVEAMLEALQGELQALELSDTQQLLQLISTPQESFEAKTITRLIERGERARAGGNVVGATDSFGRALVYCPGDKALIRRLSGLTRRRRLTQAAWVTALGMVFVGAVVWGLDGTPARRVGGVNEPESNAGAHAALTNANSSPPSATSALSGRQAASPPSLTAVDSGVRQVKNEALLKPTNSAAKTPPRIRSPKLKSTKPRGKKLLVPRKSPNAASGSADGVLGTRNVVVRITGAMGGTLRIDGETRQWFGDVAHQLSIGTHVFEFQSPDSTCCESRTRTVEIVPGPGPQRVTGQIPFREATLRVTSAEQTVGTLQCPTLFSGKHAFPGDRRVPMARLQARGVCSLTSEQPGALPQRRVIRLRAGRTTVIPWP